jgi:exopolysaccharide biosynthesis polyprenyl glycosylphosphotransferase
MVPQQLTHSLLNRGELSLPITRAFTLPRQNYLLRAYQLVDTAAVLLALFIVFVAVNYPSLPSGLADFLAMRVTVKNLLLLTGFGFLWQSLCRLCKMYDLAESGSYREEATRVIMACTLGSFCIAGFIASGVFVALPLRAAGYFWLAAIGTTLIARHITHILNPEWTSSGRRERRLLIVGSGPRARQLYEAVSRQAQNNCQFIGFVDSRSQQEVDDLVATRLIGPLTELENILTSHVVDEVLIALPIKSCYSQIQEVIGTCERVGIECKYLSDIFRVSHAKPHFERTRHFPVVSMKMTSDDYRLLVKRALDIVGALSALIVLSPVMLVTAIAIKLTCPGPIFFAQSRYGVNKRRFKMYKFRTMVPNAEALQAQLEHKNEVQGPVFKIKDDPRLTPIGKFLRKTSLDELPQFCNVLLGDMSLVGPRPLPERDVSRFSETSLLRRFSVKPGLTCLWQISGRSNTDFDNWIKQDLQYIDQWSLGLDLLILIKTLPAVLKGRGAM